MSATDAGAERPALRRAASALSGLLFALVAFRVAYHARYLLLSPFARITLSDGQVYEDAARDILAHPPWGTQPFFLQGVYAYVLAAGMALHAQPIAGLWVQLVLCGLGLLATYRALRGVHHRVAARAALAVLLAYPALWFYENKYLSAGIGVTANACCLLALVRLLRLRRRRDALLLGVALALSALARPNMLLALPFALAAVAYWHWHARARGAGDPPRDGAAPLVLAVTLGFALGLAPMALRNAIVVGEPQVFPSHGGGIPFFIGNNPHANGLWNSGGGMLTGQVAFERAELQRKLGLPALQGAALDRAIGDAMYARTLEHVLAEPGRALGLALRKLGLCLGNAEHAHDYDRLGEAQMLGSTWQLGLPFGLLLALGSLGLWLTWAEATRTPEAHARRALSILLFGQLLAVLAANVVYFHASQHRLPLSLPLAVGSAGLFAALAEPGGVTALRSRHAVACVLALLLGAQAFVPRDPRPPSRVTAAHHANLAAAYEALGEARGALDAYRAAIAQSPKQPMLRFRYGLLLARAGRTAEARSAFEQAQALATRDPLIREASTRELARLPAQP